MRVVKSSVVGSLLYLVKEIDLLKEAYSEETEFKENAAWQESFFLFRQGLVSTHGYKYGCIIFDLRRRDKSNVPPVQAIVSSTSASFKAASGHSTSWITLDQTDWHARISTTFGPALELSKSPRPEIDLLKETYPEETEFKENVAWKVSFLSDKDLYQPMYIHPGSMDKSNVPPVQAIVSSTSASFKAASGHSTSWITLGFCRYQLNRLARLD
ncbi:hypothetical protein [Oryza sativa Japonica Group]|uniref:Uncharacterized protein n=1 Tax=Oryza sativa subsp. japonica TaxID=39947 RepID=Q658D1_ORYSJ|nr:hypothetical protein [Oryza sativa Japonica Group]